MASGIKNRVLREMNQKGYWKKGDIREGPSEEVVFSRDLKNKMKIITGRGKSTGKAPQVGMSVA